MDRIGRYKIVRELGRGAMGVVYHAIDPNIGRPVAIKTIQLGGGRKPDDQERMRERLFREARSAGILSHPGIVTIYDVEQQGDLAYIAMEYVDGPTLDHLLSSDQPLSAEQMFSILGQTAVALDYAHQKGIVHRDIKPANIMIAGDGTAKITDFGIAKITASEQFTMTGSIVGTPHYMSPEQVQGQPVDGRSDQFSLAVIAFEMLTGEKPYSGEQLSTVVYKIVAEEPVAPHRLNPTLGSAIESVLRKGLAKKPEARYRNCQEFVHALEKACGESKGWKAMPRGGGLSEPTVAETVGRAALNLPPARRSRDVNGSVTAERVPKKSGFLPFLLAILMAAALLALIGWQTTPWLLHPPAATEGRATQEAQSPVANPPEPAAATTTPPATAQALGEAKPSPMPPSETATASNPQVPPAPAAEPVETKPAESAETKPAAVEPPVRPAPKRPPKENNVIPRVSAPASQHAAAAAPRQPVMVISSPAGATATLDGHPDQACITPCSIEAAPGRHTVAVTMPGYEIEHREVNVGSAPLETPVVILRAPGGILMLTSVPPGASILINGKPTGQTTPAQIHLAPGTYKVTVEKNGRQSTNVLEIRNGINYEKILLEQ
jgi:serine/threonine-protein kinase